MQSDYVIFQDDLGRWCVYWERSPYSKDSDHKVMGTLEDAQEAVRRHKETGTWE